MEKRRVVVTGMGCVSPYGLGVDTFWKNVSEGKSGIKFTSLDKDKHLVKIGGEVPKFNAEDYIDAKEVKRMDGFILYAIVAADEAFKDSKIDMKKEDVLFALDAIATPLSLYEPVYQDGGDTLYLMDQVKDKKNKEDIWVESIALKEAMDHLPNREYDIIKMRFFEGKTQTEVADEISISQAQVSRLEKNALKHMKNHLA